MFTKEVKYLPAGLNVMADWLSRKTDEALIGEAYKIEKGEKENNYAKEETQDYAKLKIAAVEQLKIDSFSAKEIAEAQTTCNDVKVIKEGKHPTSLKFETLDLDGAKVFCETSGPRARPVLPESLRPRILQSHHGIDHPGRRESERRTGSQYFWPKMKKIIRQYVTTCHTCQSTKSSKLKPPSKGEFPIPERRFSHIHVDICGPLPPSNG